MKHAIFFPLLLFCALADSQQPDFYNNKFEFRTGQIDLRDGLAGINLSDGYKYLNPAQAEFVLVNMWGNPPGIQTLGMIFPSNLAPTDSNSWAVVIEYQEDGYIKDRDADKINYDKLLGQMQNEVKKANKERKKQGYEPIYLIGWAEKPYYDKEQKKLYWAKELKFGDQKTNTLNYNIRILGRKGYLVLNIVGSMDQLAEIKPSMAEIINATEFKPGHTYAEFDPKIDKTAAYGIAAIVAGGVLAKVGFFKLLLAGIIALKKFLIIGVVAIIAVLRGLFKKKDKEQKLKIEEQVRDVNK